MIKESVRQVIVSEMVCLSIRRCRSFDRWPGRSSMLLCPLHQIRIKTSEWKRSGAPFHSSRRIPGRRWPAILHLAKPRKDWQVPHLVKPAEPASLHVTSCLKMQPVRRVA
jgi:hypothetical protein